MKYFTPKTVIFLIMAGLIIFALAKISDIVLMFFAAFVISSTLNPLINKLERRIPRTLAVTLVILALLLFILCLIIPLIALCAEQLVLVIKQIPKYLLDIENASHNTFMGIKLDTIINPAAVKTSFANVSMNILQTSIDATKILAGSLTTILGVTIMVFYISHDTKHLKKSYLALFPPKFKRKAADILEIIETKVGGFVMAQVIAIVFVGIATTLGLFLIGHNHAILLGFITAVLDIIPVIGPTIAVSIGLYTSLKFGFLYTLLTFAVYITAQWVQNQLIRPIVFGKLMDMHPLLIILSLFVGAKFLGVWGIILAPAIASVVCVLVDELYIKTINTIPQGATACPITPPDKESQES